MPRVLLLLPTTTYRTQAFLDAAARLGVDVTVGSERSNALEHLNPTGLLTVDFNDVEKAVLQVVKFASAHRIEAVVPVDSRVAIVGAAICQALGLRHNSVESAAAAGHKHRMRQLLSRSGVSSPRFDLCSFDDDRRAMAARANFPVVVKPLSLAASQGVIRADDERQFLGAVDRLEAILRKTYGSSTGSSPDPAAGQFLVEQYIDGPEFALEGMLTRGKLRVLAIFDKPDPLEGPFFEETIYVTPSRLANDAQTTLARCAQDAARALGLTEGPIHAELRLADDGPSVIEINARSIGGLCARVLRFGTGLALEELIIRHALDADFILPEREHQSAGVMMIPIPKAGRLSEIRGLEEATLKVEDIQFTAHLGQQLVPLPEGANYLGFIFARGDTPEEVETSLRDAHSKLEFVIEPCDDE